MTSVSGTKKVVKAGSSDVITVTKDISKLGISAGDEVSVRLAPPSKEESELLNIMNLSETGIYDIFNRKWICDYDADEQLDDPSRFIGTDRMVKIDYLETMYELVIGTLMDYLKSNQEFSFFFFSEETRSFVRTFPRDFDGEIRDERDKLNCQRLVLEFIYEILKQTGMEKSGLFQASDLVGSVADVLVAFGDILDNLPERSYSERLQVLNEEWQQRRKALDSIVGTFVIPIVYNAYEDYEDCAADLPKVRVVKTYSKSAIEKSLDSELAFLDKGLPSSRQHYRMLGPIPEDKAEAFAEYLRMGINLNFNPWEAEGILEWCEDQFDEYMRKIGNNTGGVI